MQNLWKAEVVNRVSLHSCGAGRGPDPPDCECQCVRKNTTIASSHQSLRVTCNVTLSGLPRHVSTMGPQMPILIHFRTDSSRSSAGNHRSQGTCSTAGAQLHITGKALGRRNVQFGADRVRALLMGIVLGPSYPAQSTHPTCAAYVDNVLHPPICQLHHGKEARQATQINLLSKEMGTGFFF